VYSSVVVMTAVLSVFFLNKKLLLQHWFALVLVTAGLGINALGIHSQGTHHIVVGLD
jgi:drug/metabolite transporter (DMT)-like permease